MIAALFLALAAAPPAVAPTAPIAASAIDPARLNAAREVVALVVPAAQREQMFETVLNSFMANMLAGMFAGDPALRGTLEKLPAAKPVFAGFVERQRKLAMADLRDTMPQLIAAYANAYARAFTVEDLAAMRQFFASPAGKRYVERSPGLLSDPDFATWQRDVAARAQGRRDAELRQLMTDLAPIIRAQESKSNGS